MRRILFVCLGNICRSPAAEALFIHKIRTSGLDSSLSCDSAGTNGYHNGSPADPRMVKTLAEYGYESLSRSRQVRPSDFDEFDYILAMDRVNLRQLKTLAPPKARAQIRLMGDFATQHQGLDVPDPYYGGSEGFVRVIEILEDAIQGFLAHLDAEARG